jgi:unsaturated rhamnogalacturonyl hydrolase
MFESCVDNKLRPDDKGVMRFQDICHVGGLGPGNKRDGSVAYYLSEPISADDAKGVGPFMMAYSEYLRTADLV